MRTDMMRGRGRVAGRRPTPVFFALLVAAGFAGCDFLDPTQVENPLTTAEDLAEAAEPVRALLPGLRAQFARMVGSHAVISEVTSDNYSIHGTGLVSEFNNPRSVIPNIINATGASTGLYWNTQELRALADFVLDEIAPDDPTATTERLAEAHYYRGMAYLYQGENYTHVPTELDGAPRPASELLQRAIADLEQSISMHSAGDFAVPARAGIARGYRLLGDASQATSTAEEVLGADPTFVFQQLYDATNIDNAPWIFLISRALKEMQPLPRLDFLDPKYISREAGIAVSKAEEMHLILAEAALAGGNLGAGRDHLVDAIQLALSRGTTSFDDDDARNNADLTLRPRDAEIVVRADPDSPFRAGLVLTRPGPIQVPTISGTSLDPDSVANLTGEDEIWHAFHLARQEIFMAEGRRMSDLGIRMPMMLREIDSNPNVQPGDPGTEITVPGYIPSGTQMNLHEPHTPYDDDGNLVTTEVTILVDMNRVLTENRVSPFLN